MTSLGISEYVFGQFNSGDYKKSILPVFFFVSTKWSRVVVGAFLLFFDHSLLENEKSFCEL